METARSINSITATVLEDACPKGYTPVTMSVYTALSKRKIMSSRLEELLEQIKRNNLFVAMAKDTDTTIDGMEREKAIANMQSTYDSISSLMVNIREINAAINTSNAITKVSLNGDTYTVTDLIYRMVHFKEEADFYNRIVTHLNNTRIAIEKNNKQELSDKAIQEYLTGAMAYLTTTETPLEEKKATEESLKEAYIASHTYKLVDPYNLMDIVPKKLEELKMFQEEVDNALNISNITTMITVYLKD